VPLLLLLLLLPVLVMVRSHRAKLSCSISVDAVLILDVSQWTTGGADLLPWARRR